MNFLRFASPGYPPELTRPMAEELTRLGFQELKTTTEVDEYVTGAKGTALIVVNSVCGCAAGMARPGVAMSLQHGVRPDRLATVFAGVDKEATARAREHFAGQPPSSPSVALLKDGQTVFMLGRHQIEGRDAQAIAADLKAAYDRYCAPTA